MGGTRREYQKQIAGDEIIGDSSVIGRVSSIKADKYRERFT